MARMRGALAFLSVLLGLGVFCTYGQRPLAARAAQDAHPRTQRHAPGRPVALFGIDAADWAVIDELVARGQLPTFARLKRVAATGIMKADPPLVSPIIWTTIATGKRAEDHGVLDFMVDTPGGGVMPVSGSARRVQAMWEIWSKAGRSVLITGWWATWPTDRVRGVIISDLVGRRQPTEQAASLPSLVFPPERVADVERWRVATEDIDRAALSAFVPVTAQEFAAAEKTQPGASHSSRNPTANLRAMLAATRTYERVSTSFIPLVHPDLWAVYYELVDSVSHLFTRDRRALTAIHAAYVEMDHALAEAAGALAPDALLVVLSDHGFYPADAGIRDDPSDLESGAVAWHRPAGVVAVTTAGALTGLSPVLPRARGPALGVVSPLDILPTLLSCASLPTAQDMPGRVLPCCDAPGGIRQVGTYGAHDQPPVATAARPSPRPEVERLRALGYVSGRGAPSSLARSHLAEMLYRKGDYRGALRELEAVLRADPLDTRATLSLARTLVALGRTTDAVQQYDRLIQIGSTGRRIDPMVFLAATDLDLREGRIEAAARRLARVPPALGPTPDVITARGAVADARRDPAEAEREYRRALEVAPADTESLERLVDLLIRSARTAAASAVTAPLARRYGSSAIHQALAGRCALAEHRYRDAEQYLSKAVSLEPSVKSLNNLALAQLQAGRKKAAAATFEQSLQLDANQPEIRKLLASAR